MHFIQSLCDAIEPRFFPRTHMRAGVKHQILDAEPIATLDFDGHRVDRLIPKCIDRAG